MTQWFPGEGRDANDQAFLAQLRADLAATGLPGVDPRDTGLLPPTEKDGPLILGVPVPGLPPSKANPTLQVGFSLRWQEPFLVGAWETYGYVLDLFDDIDTRGVAPS